MANISPEYAKLLSTKKMYKKGATAEQKRVLDYFVPDAGCAGIIKNLISSVKDEEFDAIVDDAVKASNSYKRAIDKIGLDESEISEIPPVTLYGYEDGEFSKLNTRYQFRSNRYSITHIFFSSTQVYMYQLIINVAKNEKKERTEEYFYRDITNFSTSSETKESFQYKGCSGVSRTSTEVQRFSLIVPGDKFSCSTLGDIDQQVKAMKNKLREKKL